MKKIVYLGVFLLYYGNVFSQNIVTTAPQFRNVVLEEFTGIHCGYCPDGHARAEAISQANQGRVVLINVHAGNFANPGAGEPDFRTIFGDSLAVNAKVIGYPQGTVNRHLFPEIDPSRMAIGRTYWANAAQKILPLPSPVNIGFKSSFDSTSRMLTVEVELYYTANSPFNTNFIHVALLENHVIGFQADYANGNHTDYDHKHILRHLITGLWGDPVSPVNKGALISKIYQYVVPANYNIDNCDIAVFITETRNEIYTGVSAKANGGINDGKTLLYIGDVLNPGKKIDKGKKGNETIFDLQLQSRLPGSEAFKISLRHNAPVDWNVSFGIDGNWYSDETIKTLTEDIIKDIKLKIVPGDTPAVVKVTLLMESVSNPGVIREESVYLMSGVTDLVISNSAPWGDGGATSASDFKQNFLDGLKYAGNKGYASSTTDFVLLTENTTVLEGVKNIYYNVGWSFPAFTDELVNIFKNFINNGGNMMFSGQDIGWDTWDNNGHGTEVTKAFYSNYLKADYINDGDQTNNSLVANTNDAVFGQTGSSQIVNVYGNNPDNGQPYMYPELITARSDGQAIFYFLNNPSKVAAVRSKVNDFKTVYMGVSLEMISSSNMRNEIMKLTHDWFYGLLSDIEFDQAMHGLCSIYPNPASDLLYFFNIGDSEPEVIVYNTIGCEVLHAKIRKDHPVININGLAEGSYWIKIIGNGKYCESSQLLIIRN